MGFRYTHEMIPDAATIARRRHTVTIVVRLLIALYGAFCVYALVVGPVVSVLNTLMNWSNNSGMVGSLVLGQLGNGCYVLPQLMLVVVLVLTEQRLVRWIVPIPAKHAGCPKCGYSLKDLKSPICPECGTSLRG